MIAAVTHGLGYVVLACSLVLLVVERRFPR